LGPRTVWPVVRFILINFPPLKWQNWVCGFTTFYVSVFTYPRFKFEPANRFSLNFVWMFYYSWLPQRRNW
jgi:hypothetical protein